jgi:hypothetical protein
MASHFIVVGQAAIKNDTVKRETTIQHYADDNKIRFSATTPPLQQIPGAPQAFYTYYWEFGDGTYSTNPSPEHIYKKEGEPTIRLWTTNNYDNGKPPPSRPQKIPVKKITYNDNISEQIIPGGLNLKNNREPVPDEEMVVIASYQNEADYPTNGKLYLFFNEKKFKADNFQLSEVRMHHGEKEIQDDVRVAGLRATSYDPYIAWASAIPSPHPDDVVKESADLQLNTVLEEARAQYKNSNVLEFNNMPAKESRNVFYSFKTTPEMLKDTSARITIRGIYVPEKGTDKHTSKQLEMEIVTSHDPNKMSVSDTRLNYRFYKNKDLEFKVRFQNNGEGPAHSIKLKVDVPDMYNKQTLQVIDMYPPCPICPDKQATISCLDTTIVNNQIIFHFKNIYLPGSNQKNDVDRDSTKGFVKYTLRFNEKISKQKTKSRTAIIFDKNDPILTNYTTTRFKPGLSLGAKAGYILQPKRNDARNYFAGITLSPYKSQHGYFQAELMAGIQTYSDSLLRTDTVSKDNGVANLFDVSQRNKYKNIVLYLVPVSYHYNINKFIGVGAGVQLSANLSEKKEEDALHESYTYFAKQNVREPRTNLNFNSSTESTDSFAHLNSAVFADITLGSARIGPMAGARYVYNIKGPHEQWQFYILCKF